VIASHRHHRFLRPPTNQSLKVGRCQCNGSTDRFSRHQPPRQAFQPAWNFRRG
jgi:hypothetical protein